MENENKNGISIPPVVINALYTTGGYHNKVNMAKPKNSNQVFNQVVYNLVLQLND